MNDYLNSVGHPYETQSKKARTRYGQTGVWTRDCITEQSLLFELCSPSEFNVILLFSTNGIFTRYNLYEAAQRV